MSKTLLPLELGNWRPYHLTFACAVPINAYRKGSLSFSGAILAGVFAITTLVICPTLVFAVALLVFFFSGSRATKYKAAVKATLEESEQEVQSKQLGKQLSGSDGATSEDKKSKKKDLSAGNRDAFQVACNGLVGTLACIAWIWHSGSTFSYTSQETIPCPVSENVGQNDEMKISNALVFTAVGFWAACMGDTLASELGMLAKSQPVLVTSWKRVPPGTNVSEVL